MVLVVFATNIRPPSWSTRRSCAASTTRCSPRARRSTEFMQIFEHCCASAASPSIAALVEHLLDELLPAARHPAARLPSARPDRPGAVARRVPAASRGSLTAELLDGRLRQLLRRRRTASRCRSPGRRTMPVSLPSPSRGAVLVAELAALACGVRRRPRRRAAARRSASPRRSAAPACPARSASSPRSQRRPDAASAPVQFFVDDTLLGEDDDGPPYAVEWADENPFEPREISRRGRTTATATCVARHASR